jgi:hypothetical protein
MTWIIAMSFYDATNNLATRPTLDGSPAKGYYIRIRYIINGYNGG